MLDERFVASCRAHVEGDHHTFGPYASPAERLAVVDQYEASTGIRVERHALELYRLTWDLTEIALYVDQFRRPHGDTEDTRVAWAGLSLRLDPARWSDLGR